MPTDSKRLSVTDAFNKFARFFKSLPDDVVDDFRDASDSLSGLHFGSPQEASGAGPAGFERFSNPQRGDARTEEYRTLAKLMGDIAKGLSELTAAVKGSDEDPEDQPPGSSTDEEEDGDKANEEAKGRRDSLDEDGRDVGLVGKALEHRRRAMLRSAKSDADKIAAALHGVKLANCTVADLLQATFGASGTAKHIRPSEFRELSRRPPDMSGHMAKAGEPGVKQKSFNDIADEIELNPIETADRKIAARIAANRLTLWSAGKPIADSIVKADMTALGL